MSQINVAELVAIDVHTHVLGSTRENGTAADDAVAALGGVFGFDRSPTLPEMVDYYRSRNMACVAFTIDDISRTGVEAPVGSVEIAELAADHRDVVIPFGSVDPHRGKEGIAIARTLIEEYDVRGFKFHASQQEFYPNDRLAYPLYELLAEHRLPALFHTGQSGIGRGVRGGGGIRLKYTNPMYLDDVAVDFPDMPIIMAHPSVPWQDEALAIALHKPQVYIDLSGWMPKYFPPQLVQYANSLIQDKVLFGSDFPLITPDAWIASFDELGIKESVRPKILRDNAVRLFGL
ncbi:amidohydrolase family protein [Nonomuraea harbinensis]|uniref:Amidohydrolase family protein n=1 Tax=Nonomuraea harbinensis TaxID=1286938 RepID=A0ABW1C9S5_9ACTN|nr:amidohydrolase family protein [Nonomuraea harbinensis]